jgi:tetrahydromethanopterin S-methyltransferase subunit D
MENLTALLENLAEKLGTTTEYLWSVLIKQASISAATSLIYFVLLILGGVVLYKIHKRLMKKDEDGDNVYDLKEMAIIPMIIAVIIWAIIFIICFFELGNVINGFLNPEYWALSEVSRLFK